MVLFGENKITVTEKYTQGLFFFNGNVNIDGPGSLSIEILTDLSGPPGIGLLNRKNAEPTMGNFTLRGGSIHLSLALNDFSYCLSAGKNITLEGGTLTTEGGSCSIVSTGGNIDILNAAVSCKDFDDCGLLTNNGDISIAGEDTLLNISALKDTPYTIGISAEKRAGTPHILINGGTVNISAAQGGIYADSGGDITVSEGKISVKAESADSGSAAVGIWATGIVNIADGTVSASGIANTGVGIYSDISITVSGGDVTAKGSTQAVSHAPDMTGYKYADIIAAVDFEGYQKEDFSPEEIENYQYLHISPTTAQCSVKYENGQAIIEVSQSTDAAVIFAFYNAAGRLTDFEIQNISLSEGENVVIPRHFPSYEGNAKIMLWNNISDIRPLCESEFFALPVQ